MLDKLSMEMRILLAFALSAIVLVLFAPRSNKSAPGNTSAVKQAPAPSVPKSPPPAQAVAAPKPSLPTPAAIQSAKESESVVENDLCQVRFSNRGGVVKNWVLQRYKDRRGEPLDVVNTVAVAQFDPPFAFWTEDSAIREQLNSALYAAKLSAPRAPATLTFEYSDGTLFARKEFHFDYGSYVVAMHSEVRKAGVLVPHELIWRGGFGDESIDQAHLHNQVILSSNGKHEHQTNKDVKGENRLTGLFAFVGVEDLFFAAIFMPGTDADALGVPVGHVFKGDFKPTPEASNPKPPPIPQVGIGAGGSGVNSFRVYVGPKDLDVLKTVYPNPRGSEMAKRGEPATTLAELIDFGWFTVVALPLFVSLKWIYHYIVPNYGWAIVVLTAAINFAMLPLKISSMKSALKMQKIQPQIKAIQERYKKYKMNDPKRQDQNQEVMDLYKKHGINPVGGCLPLLLQMPFLYGFYKVLSLAIEMRHAPWVFWIQDLSAPEVGAFKVLPILMIVTMVVLQKMTPQASADPVQQKMFMFMPVMFGVMFYNVSSGLVLYWLVGNVVQIGQQWYFNKTDLRPARPDA
jgi:YidC/Oxa1 family membrane protein insertase